MKASVKVTWSKSNHTTCPVLKTQNLPWFSHCSSRAKKTSHKFDFLGPVRGSGPWFRVGKEWRWTGHRGTVIYFQKVQTFTMYCRGAGGVSQELMLDVGAQSTLEPMKLEGVSVRLVMRAKTCTLTGKRSQSVKELGYYLLCREKSLGNVRGQRSDNVVGDYSTFERSPEIPGLEVKTQTVLQKTVGKHYFAF